MVYAEVFNMIMNPENYEDKIVKMKGQFVVFEDMENGNPFYACVIPDATPVVCKVLSLFLYSNTIILIIILKSILK